MIAERYMNINIVYIMNIVYRPTYIAIKRIKRYIAYYVYVCMYTVNHKKRDILFFAITLANLNRFLWFLYQFNYDEILHTTVVKFTTSH